MDNIERFVTEHFVQKIPSGTDPVTLKQLRSSDLPDFLMDRIVLEIERSLADSLPYPSTRWADTGRRNVQEAWGKFLEEANLQALLPRDHLFDVIETAVTDCIQVLTQPRKLIPKKLFGTHRHLTEEKLESQARRVVVYRQLALAPVKYLRRKNLESLSYEQAVYVISRVDEKLSGSWSPAGWVRILDPLFVLLGGEVDAEMLQLFFQDKNRPDLARRLEGTTKLDRPELERRISPGEGSDRSGSSGDFTGDTADDTGTGYAPDTAAPTTWDPVAAEDSATFDRPERGGTGSGPKGSPEKDEGRSWKWPPIDTARPGFSDDSAPLLYETQFSEEDDSQEALYSRFMKASEQDDPNDPDDPKDPNDPDERTEAEAGGSSILDLHAGEAVPESEDVGDQRSDRAEELIEWLGETGRFRHKIFRNSEERFHTALQDLSQMQEWKQASVYIQRQIFHQNGIDVYDDAAVDFTDRMHAWFLKK